MTDLLSLVRYIAFLFVLIVYIVQEEMYSFVTVADDQNTKGKGVEIVQDA